MLNTLVLLLKCGALKSTSTSTQVTFLIDTCTFTQIRVSSTLYISDWNSHLDLEPFGSQWSPLYGENLGIFSSKTL